MKTIRFTFTIAQTLGVKTTKEKKREEKKTRAVHAFHLYARPRSNEKDRSRMKLRLKHRRMIGREIRP